MSSGLRGDDEVPFSMIQLLKVDQIGKEGDRIGHSKSTAIDWPTNEPNSIKKCLSRYCVSKGEN